MIPDVNVPPEAKIDEKLMDEKTHAKPHTWINGVMLQAASETLGAPIIIWWKSQKKIWRRHTCAPAFDRNGYAKMTKTAKAIVLSLEKEHYTWVKPPTDVTIPRQWLQETVAPDPSVLSGAEGSGCCSVATPSVYSARTGQSTAKKMGRTPSVCTVATPSVRTIRHHTKVPGAFRNPSRSHKTPSVYTQQDQDHKAMRTCGLKSRGAGSNQAIVLKPKLGVRKRRLKTPSRGQQAKASVAGVDMPFLKKGRASQVTWSCPLCKYDAHGTTKAIYPQKRHHVQTRHPLEKYGNLIGKAQITVATPSADLPADARAWKCPLCPKALPALPKRETHLAISRHRREEHPEINTKDWKSAMVKVWARGVKKPKVARQSRTKADKLRKKLWPSHDLVEVYCQCPKASFHRNPTQFWCVGCMAKLAGYGGGSRPRDEKLTCHQVKKLAQAKQRVRRAWAIIKDLKTVDSKPLKHSWVRDLIEEGIEPNPGPDMLKCISLNTQGAPGAWHALQLMQEERIHVGLCRKSPCPQKKFSLSDFLPTKAGLDCIISWVMLILGQGGAEPSLYKNFYMRNF